MWLFSLGALTLCDLVRLSNPISILSRRANRALVNRKSQLLNDVVETRQTNGGAAKAQRFGSKKPTHCACLVSIQCVCRPGSASTAKSAPKIKDSKMRDEK